MTVPRRFLFWPLCAMCLAVNAQEDGLEAPLNEPVQVPPVADTGGSANRIPALDSLDGRGRHRPERATLLSAVLPGAGQIYNRKYWKAPIVWVGLGTSVWFIRDNNRQYQRYRSAYLALVDDDPTTVDEFEGRFTPAEVLEVTDTYRRWRDLSYIAFGAVYLLNVVDATVDAHFVRFDVGPDLSLRLGPSPGTMAQGAPGLSIALAWQ